MTKAVFSLCALFGVVSQSVARGPSPKHLLQAAAKVIKIEMDTGGECHWLTDAKVIVTLSGGKHPVVYDRGTGTSAPLTRTQKDESDITHQAEMNFKVRFALWSMGGSAPSPVPLKAMPPVHASIEEVTLSRDGTRLVWILAFKSRGKRTQTVLSVRRGTTRSKEAREIRKRSLWVSSADGRGMRLVFDIDEAGRDRASSGLNVEWLPSGRQISFVYGGTLYVLPLR